MKMHFSHLPYYVAEFSNSGSSTVSSSPGYSPDVSAKRCKVVSKRKTHKNMFILCIKLDSLSLIYVERRGKLPWSGCMKLNWSVMHCLFRASSNEFQTIPTVSSRYTIHQGKTPRGDSPLPRDG